MGHTRIEKLIGTVNPIENRKCKVILEIISKNRARERNSPDVGKLYNG